MTYWYCKDGQVNEVSEDEANRLMANGERVTSDPFEAAMYLGEHN